VSRSTIKRDAKISEGIEAIGAVSPEAKRQILSGEVSVGKRELEGLSSRPAGEIEAIAMRIEEGTYEKGQIKSGGQATESELILAELRRMSGAVSKLWDRIAQQGDRSEAKAELRAFLDRLEDLYRMM
jgi:hypothetical protein